VGACGSDEEPGPDFSALLTSAGSLTRAESPLAFVQALRVETGAGAFLEQTTEGVYDGEVDQASLVVTTEQSEDGGSLFVVDSTVDPGTTLRLVMDGRQVFLRVDVLGLDNTAWSIVPASEATPTADSTVAVLGAALVAEPAAAERIGEIGAEDVGGVAATRYRVPANTAEVAIYLPSETLNVLSEQGLGTRPIDARTFVEFWLDDAGRIRRIEIDHEPLLAAMNVEALRDVTMFRQRFEITQFGGVAVQVPSPAEIAVDGE